MKEYIEIAGRTFEIGDEISFRNHVNSSNYHYPSLYKCYSSPSYRKVAIYKDWFTWFDINKRAEKWQYKETIGVRSYNTYFFTLGITMYDGHEWYYLEIFPSRNIAHRLYGTH